MESDWKETTVADLINSGNANLQTGPFGTALKAAEYVTEGVPLISVREIRHGYFELTEHTPFVNEKTLSRLPKFILRHGDIVFGRKGAVDRSAMVQKKQDGWFLGSDGIRLRIDASCDHRFISYQVRSPTIQNWLMQHAEGTTMLSMNQKVLGRIPLILPPLPEQKAIAHILRSLDDKIELNRRMNATLEGMAQALFKSWFVDFDPVIDNALAAANPIPEELAERSEIRSKALADGTANREAAKQFPAVFQFTEKMGWIPERWEVKPIAEQVRLTMGQSPSSDYYNKDGNGLPFHQGVTNYGERFPKHEQYSTGGNRYAEQGDILFSVRAPVGRINISDCRIIIGRGLSALRHKKNYQAFLVYFLKNVFQKEDSIGSGTIFNAVTKKEMEKLPYIVPTDGLTKAFNNIANSLDETIACNAVQTQTLTNLRDTLLPKLISGELRIPDAEKLTEEALA